MVFNKSQEKRYDELLNQFDYDNQTYYPENYGNNNFTVYDLDDKEERRRLIENAVTQHGYGKLNNALSVRFKILAMLYEDMKLSNNEENLGIINKKLNNISEDIEWFRNLPLYNIYDYRTQNQEQEQDDDWHDKTSSSIMDELDIEYEEKEEEQTPQNRENEYTQEYRALEERCTREREEVETQRVNEARAFQEKINETVKHLTEIQDIYEILKRMNNQCEIETNVLKEDAKKYNETFAKNRILQNEIDNLRFIGGNNEQRIKELEDEIQKEKSKGGEYEELEKRLGALNREFSSVQQLLSECERQKQTTENDLARAKKDISDFNIRNQKIMENMIKKHAENLSILRDEKDKCKMQNNKLISEQAAKETLHEQLEEQLLEKERVIAESRELAQKYISENNENENLLRFAKTQLDKANQLNNNLQQQIVAVAERREKDEVEFNARVRQVQDLFRRKLEDCQRHTDYTEAEYKRKLEENANSNPTVKRYLGSPNTCRKTGWVVNPETGRCWKETNPGYTRRLRWTPDKDSPKFKSKRAKSNRWELNQETGRYRLKNKRG